MAANRGGMSEDRDGAPVFLARNAWELGYIAEKSPKIKVLRHPRAVIVFPSERDFLPILMGSRRPEPKAKDMSSIACS